MNILNKIKSLSVWLKNNGYIKEAQELEEIDIEEWKEPWHEEAAKEFGADPITEEEYYSKEISPQKLDATRYDVSVPEVVYLKIMEKEKFQPSSAGGKSLLGVGVMGKVFRGIFNSQPVAAKIIIEGTYDSDTFQENEYENWKIILEAKQKMPEKLKKHIPNIYHMNSGTININEFKEEEISKLDRMYEVDSSVPISYSIIIMEELNKLSERMRELFRGYGQESERQKMRLLKDDDYLFTVSKNIKNALEERFNYLSVNENDIFKILYDNLKSDAPDVRDPKWNEVTSNVSKLIYNLIEKQSERASDSSYDIERIVAGTLRSAIRPRMGVPREWRHYDKTDPEGVGEHIGHSALRSMPETENLMETLETLAVDFNLGWKDFHANNVLMGNDGNFKIIDVGLYEDIHQ
jgi:hypothetical protein